MPRLAPKIDYGPIKTEYVETEVSIRKLAAKHGISFGTLAERARNEGWQALRQAHGRQVAARTYEGMMSQIAEQERAIKLTQIAVMRASLHSYAADLKEGKIHLSPRDAVLVVEALSKLLGEGNPVGDGNPAEPKNVTPPGSDPNDPEFWRQLVDTARTRVAASGGLGPAPLSGVARARTN